MGSKISSISGREILDSRGNPTIEVKLASDNGEEISVSLPQGISRGGKEAVYLPPPEAIKKLNEEIYPALAGMSLSSQREIDNRLLELDGTADKSRLGANGILGVSLAAARAEAKARRIPFWKYLRELSGLPPDADKRPRLFMNFIEGGKHASTHLQFQEYLVIPKEDSFATAWQAGKKIHKILGEKLAKDNPAGIQLGDEGGFAPDLPDDLEPWRILKECAEETGLSANVDFGLDAAANNSLSSSDELFLLYERMAIEFNLFYLEDPFGEEDWENFSKITSVLGGKTIIAGDDLTATNRERMRESKEKKAINGVIIKPNQIGTLSETIEAVKLARTWEWKIIVSHRGGETMDDLISDMAFGFLADGFKLGTFTRPERVVKYQRLVEIEKKL